MQQPDQWLDPTRDRLRQWARWLRSTSSPISGAVTMRYQAREIDPVYEGHIEENGEAERIDLIMCRVRETDALVYRVVFDYYYHHEKSERELASDLHISRSKVTKLRAVGETMVDVWWRALQSGASLSCVA